MSFDLNNIVTIVSIVIAIVSTFGGGIFWNKAKAAIKETADLFNVLSASLEDDKISDKEKEDIIKEWKDILAVFKKKTE